MIHFIRQMEAYCQLEVIECSWKILLEFCTKKEGDLDALIEAHPYQGGAHGDELRREDWQAEYDKWTQKLQSMRPTAGQMELNNSQDEEAMQVDEEEEEGAEAGGRRRGRGGRRAFVIDERRR